MTAAVRPDPAELRRQLTHVGVLLFALPVPWLGPRGAVLLATAAVLFNWVVLPLSGLDGRLRRADERFVNGVRLYPLAVLGLLVLLPIPLALAGWAILATGDAFSNLCGRAFGRRRLPWNPAKSWAGTLGFLVTAFPAAWLFLAFGERFAAGRHFLPAWAGSAALEPAGPAGGALLCLAAAAAGALVESLPLRLDDNLSVSIAAGGTLAALAFVL